MTAALSDPAYRAHVAMNLLPASIADALLNDPAFTAEHGIQVDASVTFGANELRLGLSQYEAALRQLYNAPEAPVSVTSISGEEWQLSFEELPDQVAIILSKGPKRLRLPDRYALSPDVARRLAGFDRVATSVSLPIDAAEHWQAKLRDGPLTDAEAKELEDDLAATPARMLQSLRQQLDAGESTSRSLVPSDGRYYDRLVGIYDGSEDVVSYFEGGGRRHLESLAAQGSTSALLASLRLCAHPNVARAVNPSKFAEPIQLDALDHICEQGDFISKLGAIETFLPLAGATPISLRMGRLIEQLSAETTDASADRYLLLSSLIILVDGELSNTRTLSSAPPFWRRLAAITHASLIENEIVRAGIDVRPLTEWITHSKAGAFELQTLCDLRLEPRWLPEMVGKGQLRAEFIGRVYAAALQYQETLPKQLKSRILSKSKNSIKSKVHFPFAYFPGPLEGGIASTVDPPDDIVKAIESNLAGGELTPQSFAALVNASAIFRVTHTQAEMAASALRATKYQLYRTDDDENLLAVLKGLATVAATTRSTGLSNELRILLRLYRNQKHPALTLHLAMTIGLLGAAAHSELGRWAEYAGDWLTELAFQELTAEEAHRLSDALQVLCMIVPQLWQTTGRAQAALNSIT